MGPKHSLMPPDEAAALPNVDLCKRTDSLMPMIVVDRDISGSHTQACLHAGGLSGIQFIDDDKILTRQEFLMTAAGRNYQ